MSKEQSLPTWEWEQASPLTKVICGRYEQDMTDPIIAPVDLINGISLAFRGVSLDEARELSTKSIIDIIARARAGDIERSTFQMAIFGGGNDKLIDLALDTAREEAVGNLQLAEANINVLAATALANMVHIHSPNLV